MTFSTVASQHTEMLQTFSKELRYGASLEALVGKDRVGIYLTYCAILYTEPGESEASLAGVCSVPGVLS